MNIFRFTYLLSLIILLSGNYAVSQKLKQLESKKKKTLEDINYTNKLLNETKEGRKDSYNKLVILNKKISLRNNLISDIKNEISIIDTKIRDNTEVIRSLESDLNRLKDEYAKMIYYAYKNKNSYDRLIHILASDDFNQAYRRLKYLQQYTAFRRKQSNLIMATQEVLNKKIAKLEARKEQKEQLIKSRHDEAVILSLEKSEQSKVLNKLQSRESELKKKLEQQRKTAAQLNREIEKIIAEEARKAAERAKASGSSKVFELTPEERLISDNFENNKGRLPWPTERGIITGTFGEHEHPVLKGIIVRNNGVDICTTKGATARAIFDGVVSKVVSIPGAHKAVIIRHGEYLTVYSNLREVIVKPEEKVKAKQSIGTIYTDANDGNKTALHIEIWKQNTKLNPAHWLTKR